MTLKFGELEKVATDDGFIWYAETGIKSEIFGQVVFCLVSTDRADVDDETTMLAERIASDIDRYVKEALGFLKDELRRGRFLSKNELSLLDVPVCNLPFSSPHEDRKAALAKGIEKLEARNKKEKDYFLDKDNLANFKAMRKQNGTDEKFCF